MFTVYPMEGRGTFLIVDVGSGACIKWKHLLAFQNCVVAESVFCVREEISRAIVLAGACTGSLLGEITADGLWFN